MTFGDCFVNSPPAFEFRRSQDALINRPARFLGVARSASAELSARTMTSAIEVRATLARSAPQHCQNLCRGRTLGGSSADRSPAHHACPIVQGSWAWREGHLQHRAPRPAGRGICAEAVQTQPSARPSDRPMMEPGRVLTMGDPFLTNFAGLPTMRRVQWRGWSHGYAGADLAYTFRRHCCLLMSAEFVLKLEVAFGCGLSRDPAQRHSDTCWL